MLKKSTNDHYLSCPVNRLCLNELTGLKVNLLKGVHIIDMHSNNLNICLLCKENVEHEQNCKIEGLLTCRCK